MEEKYTFGPEEKEILEILTSFEKELNERLQKSDGEIEKVKYYETFQMQGIDFNHIFVTTEKDAEGNISYHVYCGSSNNEILSIDSNGEIKVNPELEKYLEEIDLEKIMEENEKETQRLKGISEKMDPEEEKALQTKKVKESVKGKDEEEENETKEVEKDLEEQGQDLQISKYRKIKDKHLSERMPNVFDNSTEGGIAYSNKLKKFVMITKENGQYQLNENVESAQMTSKTIISIDEKGEKIERKVPHALMKTNTPNREIAVTIGQYGDIDIETVEVLPCQERIARGIRTQGEGTEKEENYQVRKEFQTGGKEYPHEIAHQVEKVEEAQSKASETIDYDITESDYIPNTKMTWGELKEETGESLLKLVERYNKEVSEKGLEPTKAVQTIENDYGNISHEHKRS